MRGTRNDRNRKLRSIAALLCCAALLCAGGLSLAAPGELLRDKYNVKTQLTTYETASVDYETLLRDYAERNLPRGQETYTATPWTDCETVPGYAGYDGDAFLWRREREEISARVRVEQAGIYALSLDYLPFDGEISLIQRGVLVDGAAPSEAHETCPFPRKWREDGAVTADGSGDEKAPPMVQVTEWSRQFFLDANALYTDPLMVYLEAGEHTITLVYIVGDMAVGRLYVEPAPALPAYAEYAAQAGDAYAGDALVLEAETAAFRTDRAIRRMADGDPATSPFDAQKRLLNVIGGSRWQEGWQGITWQVEAPADGWYQFSLRLLQTNGDGLTVFRRLLIDGALPFEEAAAVALPYASEWQTVTLGGDAPYRFYLTRGTHEISLQAVCGDLSGTVLALRQCSAELSALLMDISAIVGTDPDLNFDYQLTEKIDWLLPTLTEIRDALHTQAGALEALCGRQTILTANLYSTVEELNGYLNRPKTIPAASGSEGSLTVMQTNLASWYGELLQTPVTLDLLILSAPGAQIMGAQSTFGQRMSAGWTHFISSFTKDYNRVGGEAADAEQPAVSVWIARGREWGEALQKMADEEFTPQTGIRVEINILPSGSVGAIGGVSPILLSLVSGSSPNVAIGSDSSTPVELAIRDSAVDLSRMPGFEELERQFVPGALEPLRYQGGIYALPETMDFQVMFYRTDILERLGLSLPDTWEDLYNKVLPTLKQNNYDFFIPITTSASSVYQYCAFYTYLFQRGGDLYDEAGLKTLLDSDVSYAAFAQWVQNYTRYNLPREINVFNHFRTGDIPLFIGGLNEYLALKVAAPELYGKWAVTLIPGTMREDGTIDRSAIGALSTCLMFDKGEEENAAAWAFLSWYMSADVQYRFADEIEAAVGLQGRWFTANTEAFSQIPWEARDLAVFTEAMQWMRNPRNVLGGYITGRQLNNAWTRAVMSGQSTQEALEDAVKEIQRELRRKQEEYGIEVNEP